MTRRPPLPFLVLGLLAPVFALLTAVTAATAEDCGPGAEAVHADGLVLCTHGNDDPPPGVDTTELPSTAELLAARFGVETPAEVASELDSDEPEVVAANTVACIGDGVNGARVQLVYARASDVASRYSSVLPLLRQYASDADDIINVSAGRVGDGRRVRYVTNSSCAPEVLNVTLSKTGDDNFGNMVTELRNMGLNHVDRKYLVFMDAAVGICGLGELYNNDRPDELNPNNVGRAMYARVDTSCWQYAAAHEMLHNLGAVQYSAPNTSGYGHCTDDVDVMCYKDHSTTVVRQVCDRAGQVDCNNDDYFHPNPKANSYLANKWNVARSRYLAAAEPPPPPVTSVTVQESGFAGIPWAVKANLATADATVVWSSTRSECWFGDARAADTSWTCPATAQGTGEITATVTEGGIATPFTTPVALLTPSTKRSMSVAFSASSTKITAGETVSMWARFNDMGTGSKVAGLPVTLDAKPKGSSVFSAVATGTTNREGNVRIEVAPTRNTTYRIRSNVNPTWSVTYSSTIDVSVATKLKTKVNSKTVSGYTTTEVNSWGKTKITGKVGPNRAGKTIRLRKHDGKRWRTIRSQELSDESTYRFIYKPKRSGKHYLRVVKPADWQNLMSRKAVTLKVG